MLNRCYFIGTVYPQYMRILLSVVELGPLDAIPQQNKSAEEYKFWIGTSLPKWTSCRTCPRKESSFWPKEYDYCASRSPAPSHARIGVRRQLQRSLLIFVAFFLIPLKLSLISSATTL